MTCFVSLQPWCPGFLFLHLPLVPPLAMYALRKRRATNPAGRGGACAPETSSGPGDQVASQALELRKRAFESLLGPISSFLTHQEREALSLSASWLLPYGGQGTSLRVLAGRGKRKTQANLKALMSRQQALQHLEVVNANVVREDSLSYVVYVALASLGKRKLATLCLHGPVLFMRCYRLTLALVEGGALARLKELKITGLSGDILVSVSFVEAASRYCPELRSLTLQGPFLLFSFPQGQETFPALEALDFWWDCPGRRAEPAQAQGVALEHFVSNLVELRLRPWARPVVNFLSSGRFLKLCSLAVESGVEPLSESLELARENFPQLTRLELRNVPNGLIYSPVSSQLESLKVLGEWTKDQLESPVLLRRFPSLRHLTVYGKRGVDDRPEPSVQTLFFLISRGVFLPLLEEVCFVYDDSPRPFLGLDRLERAAADSHVRFFHATL